MASLDFPASPTTGQLFSAANGVTYRFDGTLWLVQAGPGGGTGSFQAVNSAGYTLSGTAAVLPFNTVQIGNEGSWYAASGGTAGRYTPPAGRFQIYGTIFGGAAGVTTLILQLRKNGVATPYVQAQAAAGAGVNGQVSLDAIVDANGTDYFELWGASGGGGTNFLGYFMAFPLTGMQGPQGAPPTAGGGIIREVTLASPAASIDLFDLNVKTAQLVFYLQPVTDGANLLLRIANSSTLVSSASYFTQSISANAATVGASVTASTTAFDAANSVTSSAGQGVKGSIMFSSFGSSLPSSATGQLHWNITGSLAYYMFLKSFINGNSGNGLQFAFSSGNIATGSFVRVIGWP